MPLTSSTKPISPTSAAAYFAKRRRRGPAFGASAFAAAALTGILVSTAVVISSFCRSPRIAATPDQVQNLTFPHVKLYHCRRSVERQFAFSRHQQSYLPATNPCLIC